MPRYFIQLAYNGLHFNGWQIQDNTPNTIQHILQQKQMSANSYNNNNQ